jgi:hypothetical protein
LQTLLALPLGLLILLVGCAPQPTPSPSTPEEAADGPPWFEDVTDQVGVHFVHDPGPLEKYPMYQSIGSGVAACDLDGDGRPDLLFLTNAGPASKSTNALYRQKPDGTFEDVTRGSGLDFASFNMGVAVGDVNNDGRPDIVVTQYGGIRLFLNRGNMKFEDVTEAYGLKNPLWGTSAAFIDYDRDGWLDLVVVNYVDYEPGIPCHSRSAQPDYCGPNGLRGSPSKLFRNHEGKRFEDVSIASRIGAIAIPGLGVAVADFDGDTWPDIFVANDGQPNCLWINQKNGTFRNEAVARGVAYTQMGLSYAGMGVAVGDVDNDGQLDLYVTHYFNETNTLWKQGPRGAFRDATAAAGLTRTRQRSTGWGTLFADFDNDGWLDLAIANGAAERRPPERPRPGVAAYWSDYADRNQLLRGEGWGRFKDISNNSTAFCGYYTVARGLVAVDLDGDGGIDLVVNSIGEPAKVFRNVCPARGHWLTIRLRDPSGEGESLGAEIGVTAGGTRRMRVIAPAESFLSSGSARAHFGLGQNSSFDSIDVLWPDGTREDFPGGTTDRLLELHKGRGRRR